MNLPAHSPTYTTHAFALHQLSVWKTDRMMRPIHIVSYDEQPGCSIKTCVMGLTEATEDGSSTSSMVYYGVDQNNITIVKWANDQGYTGIVQVRICNQVVVRISSRDIWE